MKLLVVSTLTIASLAVSTLPALAQHVRWERNLDTGDASSAYVVRQDGSNFYAAGAGGDYPAPHGLVVRFDGAGKILWQRTVGGKNDPTLFYALAVMPDHGIVVAGGENNRSFLHRYDATGKEEWVKPVLDTGAYPETWNLVADDSGITATGLVMTADSANAFLERFGLDGTPVWTSILTTKDAGGPAAGGRGLARTADGGYAVAGTTHNSDGSGLSLLARFDASGRTAWARSYPGSGSTQDPDESRAVVATSDGFVLAGLKGRTGASAGSDIDLIRTDAMGNLLWRKALTTAGENGAEAIAQAGEDYLVSGYNGSGPKRVAHLFRVNPRGTALWDKNPGGQDVLSMVVPDGQSLVVAGRGAKGFRIASLDLPK